MNANSNQNHTPSNQTSSNHIAEAYEKPEITIIEMEPETVLLVGSPTKGGSYKPGKGNNGWL